MVSSEADMEKGTGVEVLETRHGNRKRLFKPSSSTAGSTKMRLASALVSLRKKAAAKTRPRHGDSSKPLESKARSSKKAMASGGAFLSILISSLSIGVLFGFIVLWEWLCYFDTTIWIILEVFTYMASTGWGHGVVVRERTGKLWWRSLRKRRWGERGVILRLLEHTSWYNDGFDQFGFELLEYQVVMYYKRLHNFGFFGFVMRWNARTMWRYMDMGNGVVDLDGPRFGQ
ncbi:hypothetical protein F2Q68_00030627 [Brassica cretica]|uniref:Uncharacterized protein n=1 Tax=Brassica cretica TaxID=69181 RepID=A0A8S9G9K0_BRACR|nr:hypothetical protein F2Q68_00030627 [Brassica cretica]